MWGRIISTHALTEGDAHYSFQQFQIDISTHALTEGDEMCVQGGYNYEISTHALTEGDGQMPATNETSFISTHGGRLCHENPDQFPHLFQLTPSRRATFLRLMLIRINLYFNSRPHGGRQLRPAHLPRRLAISTHALTEGDHSCCRYSSFLSHFNSRPHGGRHPVVISFLCFQLFQLTPSRRATCGSYAFYRGIIISTHALTEGDRERRCLFGIRNISTHALTEGDLLNV